MMLAGQKRKKLFTEFIEKYFPSDIENYIYVEPFGGTFSVASYLSKKPLKLIYNDIFDYDFPIVADEKLHKDYSEVLREFDSTKTFFYLDPPYYGKEHLYSLEDFDDLFHVKLRDNLISTNAKTVISYEDCDFIRQLWEGYKIVKYTGENPLFKNEILILLN